MDFKQSIGMSMSYD